MTRPLLTALLALLVTAGTVVRLQGGGGDDGRTGAAPAFPPATSRDPAPDLPDAAPAPPTRLTADPDVAATADVSPASPPAHDHATDLAASGPPAGFVGRVLGPDGSPVIRARISPYHADGDYASRVGSTRSDDHGRFATKPALPGVYELRVTAQRLELLSLPGLRVSGDGPLDLGDLVLEPGSSVTGRVKDQDGAPLDDVKVEGRPASGNGRLCSTRTGDDGRFTLWLPEAVPYDVEVREQGFVPSRSERPAVPGDRNLDITLTSIRSEIGATVLHVRDAATGDAITRFGAWAWQHSTLDGGQLFSIEQDRAVEIANHPDGRCELELAPRTHGWKVNAPGYGSAHGRLQPGVREVFVDLPPEAVLSGRVVADGGPVPGARVLVERRRLPPPDGEAEDEPNVFLDRFDVGPYAGRKRETVTDDRGRFRFEQLQGGTWQVTVSAPEHPTLSIPTLSLTDGETRDVGDLTPPAFAMITGRVLLPPGYGAAGLAVTGRARGFGGDLVPVAVRDDGSFSLPRVPPVPLRPEGRPVAAWALDVAPVADGAWSHQDPRLEGSPFLALPPSDALLVEPSEGETVDVVIDLRQRIACVRGLIVRWYGAPLGGARVTPVAGDGRAKPVTRTTDGDGLAVVPSPCDVPLRVTVASRRRLPLGSFDIPPGTGDVTVEVDAGRLALLLPEALTQLPKHGGYLYRWPAGDTPDWSSLITLAGSTWSDQVYEGSRRIDLGPFAPGTWDLLLRIAGHEWRATATVVPGGSTEVGMAP